MNTTQQQTNGTKAAPATAPQKRMSLTKLVRGKLEEARRILLYGMEGIGKSTFAAGAPSPIFIGAESGTSQLDVVRFPKPDTWQDILDAVHELTVSEHEFKTLVLDTADAAEAMLWSYMCARDSVGAKSPIRDIEDYGYGKGYQKALDEWRVFLAACERLRTAKRMNIILLAHGQIKPFKNPEGDDFDRYELKLNGKAGGLLKEWCDAVLFANYETYALKDEKTKRVRGVSTGARMIFTTRTAAYDAKNRYGLPESLPLSWSDFDAAASNGNDVETLKADITKGAEQLEGDRKARVLKALADAGDDAGALVSVKNRLNATLSALKQTTDSKETN